MGKNNFLVGSTLFFVFIHYAYYKHQLRILRLPVVNWKDITSAYPNAGKTLIL